jgi:hypothetical protein
LPGKIYKHFSDRCLELGDRKRTRRGNLSSEAVSLLEIDDDTDGTGVWISIPVPP